MNTPLIFERNTKVLNRRRKRPLSERGAFWINYFILFFTGLAVAAWIIYILNK